MATSLGDARIKLTLDVTGAKEKLDGIEDRVKKDDDALKKTEKKQKASKKKQKQRGDRERTRSAAVTGAISGAVSAAVPYGQLIGAAASIIEYGGPAAITALEGALKHAMPDVPLKDEMIEAMLMGQKVAIKALSDSITKIKGTLEAIEASRANALDIVTTATGLGIPIDTKFLIEHTKAIFKISAVQSELQANIKKTMSRNMMKALGSTFSSFLPGP